MSNNKRFPVKDSDFSVAATSIVNYLSMAENKSRLVVTPAAVAALAEVSPLINTFSGLVLQCQNPNLSTSTLVADKNTTRSRMETCFRIIYDDIARSVLTRADRDTLNIPLPSTTRTPSQTPMMAPAIEVAEQMHNMLTLILRDVYDQKSTAMPTGISNIEIQYAPEIIAANGGMQIPAENNYLAMGFSGKSKYIYRYGQEMVRQTVFIRARYLNTRNEPGPWCKPVTITLI